MINYLAEYRSVFLTLGYELRSVDGYSKSQIVDAEARLKITLPLSLRGYYLVAGRESKFNQVFNHLLAPDQWSIDSDRLVFMEENQAVVLWGVPSSLMAMEDSPVFQGVNGKQVAWQVEHESCSTFLKVMIHWHGTFGGAMSHPIVGYVDGDAIRKQLDREWNFIGEVNQMRCYNQQGCAVCFLKWEDPLQSKLGLSPWRVFAGANSESNLQMLQASLKAQWE